MPSEKFHEEQPLPDDDPIPDHPNQLKKVVEEDNSDVLALVVIGEKNWTVKQKKFPWSWKGQDESAEGTQKEEKEEEKEKDDDEEEEEKEIPVSSFPLKEEPLDASDTEEEESSDEESEDSGFEEEMEEEEADKSLAPFLGLALGSALLGGSLGYCRAR